MAFISLQNVSLDIPIYDSCSRQLRQKIFALGKEARIGTARRRQPVVHALRNISLEFNDGDRVALIGPNGAGKSTLLRVLTGVYETDHGQIVINGTVTPLLDLTLGMDIEATGYENIYLRGLLLGMDKISMKQKVSEIEQFTELGDYLYMPIRTYSSGMLLRLAFAVSTVIEPDILLIDEIIGVGDSAFIERAQARLIKMMGTVKILFLASHAMDIVRKMCNKGVYLNDGEVVLFSSVDETIKAYESAP